MNPQKFIMNMLSVIPKRPSKNWAAFLWSALGACVCGLAYTLPARGAPRSADTFADLVLLLLGISCFAATWVLLEARPWHRRLALVVHAVVFLFLMSFFSGFRPLETVLLSGVIVEISVCERYPSNLTFGASIAFLSLTVRFLVFVQSMKVSPQSALVGQADYALLAVLIVWPTCLAAKYREDALAMKVEKARLDEAAVELTRLNLQYQNVAANAAEAAMEDERKRITRDVHDIVGYTLTNNIAMMEAATDMMRRNPLGVPALINAARENAEEGLGLVRDALYRLRDNPATPATGLHSLARLCKMFEQATGTSVRFEYGNSNWNYGETLDSTIHHLVQGALINSFRHGKAGHVTIALFEVKDNITLSISDDGRGAGEIREGIGLKGMRERVESVGGMLQVDGAHGGFSLLATIPKTTGGASWTIR